MRSRSFVALMLATLTGCAPVFTAVRSEVIAPAPAGDTIVIEGPVKAFTDGGRIALFPGNVRLAGGRISGIGSIYDVALGGGSPVSELSMDSVQLIVRADEKTVNPHLTAGAAVVSVAGLIAIVVYLVRFGAVVSMPS